MNIEQARTNMIKQQLHTWDVFSPTILTLFETLPREDFMLEPYQQLAFADTFLPIGHGQKAWTPKMEAKVLQSLNIQPTDKVLEIGTGCGFFTSLLARLANQVFSIELYHDLSDAAENHLAKQGIKNVVLATGNGCDAWSDHSPYDVIVFTGSLPHLPPTAKQQLKTQGRLFCIVGEAPAMRATLITKHHDQRFESRVLFETDMDPLLKFEIQPTFAF